MAAAYACVANSSGDGSDVVTLPISRIEPRVPESFGAWASIWRVTRGRDEHLGAQVQGHGRLPRVGGDRVDRAVTEAAAASTGDREEAVDPPEALHDGADGGVHFGLLGQLGLRPRGTQALREVAGVLGGARSHEDGRSLADEALRGRGRDAGRARDQDDAIAQSVHGRS